LGAENFVRIVDEIKRLKPAVVFNTVNGDSNLAFYYNYNRSGIRAEETPVMAFSIGEVELKDIGPSAVGHYACSGYFQCLNTPENAAFIDRYQNCYGKERVVSDAVASAYTQPFLWKELVERSGTFDIAALKKNIPGTTHRGPGGTITIHGNHHAFKPALIGRVNADLQFDIIWQCPQWIKPLPWLGLEDVDFAAKELIMETLAGS
jgi:ABC-type branched-subunit amino acid transport system substrate-binding protein